MTVFVLAVVTRFEKLRMEQFRTHIAKDQIQKYITITFAIAHLLAHLSLVAKCRVSSFLIARVIKTPMLVLVYVQWCQEREQPATFSYVCGIYNHNASKDQ